NKTETKEEPCDEPKKSTTHTQVENHTEQPHQQPSHSTGTQTGAKKEPCEEPATTTHTQTENHAEQPHQHPGHNTGTQTETETVNKTEAKKEPCEEPKKSTTHTTEKPREQPGHSIATQTKPVTPITANSQHDCKEGNCRETITTIKTVITRDCSKPCHEGPCNEPCHDATNPAHQEKTTTAPHKTQTEHKENKPVTPAPNHQNTATSSKPVLTETQIEEVAEKAGKKCSDVCEYTPKDYIHRIRYTNVSDRLIHGSVEHGPCGACIDEHVRDVAELAHHEVGQTSTLSATSPPVESAEGPYSTSPEVNDLLNKYREVTIGNPNKIIISDSVIRQIEQNRDLLKLKRQEGQATMSTPDKAQADMDISAIEGLLNDIAIHNQHQVNNSASAQH
ncbi:hypothetical protein H4R33_007033, partial [Dimargaris cristalligena]